MFNSNLANWFFSDKRKLYTKQKGCHGVGERVGQDLELYTCISKKILSPQHRKRISDSWQCVPPRRPRGFGADSVDRVPRRGKAEVRGVVRPLTHGAREHSRPDMKKLR